MFFLKRLKIKLITKKLKSMQQSRMLNQPKDESIAKEIEMYMGLAALYRSINSKKKFPFSQLMVKECLRAAAFLDSSRAQYELAILLLEEAKFRDTLEKEGLFANPSNLRQSAFLFEEAHAYLLSAEKLNHALAKRMRGLCFINAWGVKADHDKGFELIVASIDEENTWDKVPQIFASLGLNKPEFFSELGKHRGKN